MKRAAWALLTLLLMAAVAVGGWLWLSRPSLAGRASVPGLVSGVSVAFDALGIPSVQAETREDAFRALGYISARERMFQMDLSRRNAAGRLAEVFGAELVELDTTQRVFGFASVAAQVLERLPGEQRAALEAYADGVNAYLHAATLRAPEFALLGYEPEAWQPIDSILVALGMFQVLSNSEELERTRSVMARALPPRAAAFMLDGIDDYTAALLPSASARAPQLPREELEQLARGHVLARLSPRAGEPPIGSNAWAVAGSHTHDGRAILANDMHLDLGVPNTWYRVELHYGTVHTAGVTLPGLPALLVGSNRHVAWGLTNLEGDAMDLVTLELRDGRYVTPQGDRDFSMRAERVKVRGASDVVVQVRSTIWGPVLTRELLGRPVAVRWSALDPEAIDLDVIALDRAHGVDDAVALMREAGMPPSNVVFADERGRVAWTVSGRIPRRHGFDGAASTSWADGTKGWDGYLNGAELPAQIDPESGFVVSANQRMAADGPQLGHDFGHGYRAFRITELLRAAPPLTEADVFRMQLDTRGALYLPYQQAALAAAAAEPALQATLAAWDGRAEIDSRSFALIDRFRRKLIDRVFGAWLATCRALEPDFQLDLSDLDTPLQRVLQERSLELIDVRAPSWDAYMLDVLRAAAAEVGQRSWGELQRVEMRHVLSSALPGASWLDMPAEPLPGCGYCVRLASHQLGASQRLVVSPGHETQAILHMPGGQSGHPLSPHYDDQQSYWVHGTALPLLSGKPSAALRLELPRPE